jgi:hypothetical protein
MKNTLLSIKKDYPDILPAVKVCKKTDWRIGEDEFKCGEDTPNARKYAKYKFLGKI